MLSFDDESIEFQCNYPRTVNTDVTVERNPKPESQPATKTGQLSYNIDVAFGDPGADSVVTISPNHIFGSYINPRYI